jgi:hypothetical protein
MQAQTSVHADHETSPGAAALSGKAGASKKGQPANGPFGELLSRAREALTKPATSPGLEAEASRGAKRVPPAESQAADRGAAVEAAARRRVADSSLPNKGMIGGEAPEARVPGRRPGERAARGLRTAEDPERGAEELGSAKLRPKAKEGAKASDAAESAAGAVAGAAEAARLLVPGKALNQAAKPAGKGEAEAAGKIEDPRGKERRAEEPRVSVVDLRRPAAPKAGAREAAKDGTRDAKAEELVAKDGAPEARPRSAERPGESYRELVLDARAGGDSAGTAKADGLDRGADSGAAPRDFQSLLAQRMQEAWNGEIVQSAQLILRDGDAGTIRLRLRPESLGNVKIELNLSDNNINGRIVVESDAAKSAFERNMNELADAFRQGGFDSARLEVAVGGGSGGQAGRGGEGEGPGPFYSERLRSAVASPAEPAAAERAYRRSGSSVDMFA